jgi:hypothetical protein
MMRGCLIFLTDWNLAATVRVQKRGTNELIELAIHRSEAIAGQQPVAVRHTCPKIEDRILDALPHSPSGKHRESKFLANVAITEP